METLGHLAWWRVSNVELPYTLAETLMADLGFPIAPPNPVLPVDAFRRLSGEASAVFQVDDVEVTLDLHEVPGPSDAMLVRHIVRTARRNRVNLSMEKVGDVVFYKPPKGQHARARMRVGVQSTEPQVVEFAASLKERYNTALGSLDSQAVRRMIRSHIAAVGALSLSGPYFFRDHGHLKPLVGLFDHLGPDSVIHHLPVMDDEIGRGLLAAAEKEDVS